jgi:hypothetical protein
MNIDLGTFSCPGQTSKLRFKAEDGTLYVQYHSPEWPSLDTDWTELSKQHSHYLPVLYRFRRAINAIGFIPKTERRV